MTANPLSLEAAALHAVIEDDTAHARHLLARLSGGELVSLYHQLDNLRDLVTSEYNARGPHHTPLEARS